MPEVTDTFFAPDRKRWRAWLRAHHRSRTEIWLVFLRKSVGRPCVTYDEAVEEALCWGWIDGIKKKVDGERYAYRFTPRRPGSAWSAPNRERVARLERAGKLASPGRRAVEAARADGTFEASLERDDSMPETLKHALARDRRAAAAFDALTPAMRRQWRLWINDARREETRKLRVRRAIEALRSGRRTVS